jgi:hypothetical protein
VRFWLFYAALLFTPGLARAPQPQGPHLVAHYPLAHDLDDATGNNAPVEVKNAPFQAGKSIFCNGRYVRDVADACVVRSPMLKDLDVSAFTISAQFLIPRAWVPTNPVLVAGASSRWLSYDLQQGGGVRLVYNSNQIVACSVKYRIGFWHEATITFDGDTTTLYLDGVPGCRVKASLQPGNEKFILLTNFGNATAFYGMFRDLKIYNGVVVPPHKTPVADDLPDPSPQNLAPVDLFLKKCPTLDQLASVDADLRLAFESDPTKDEPLACTANGGSRDLSPMKRRVYNSLLLMRQIQFDRPLPWTKEPLYRWLVGAINGIRFRGDITNSSCCNPERTVAITTAVSIRSTDRWVEPAMHGGLDGFILVLVHEARHAQGAIHTCGTKDRRLDEMGSWAVQYYLARWLAEHTDQSLFTSGTIRYTERLVKEADNLLQQQFCGR